MTDQKGLRPNLNLPTDQSRPDEVFQNETLRPILKMQHDLLLKVFYHHLEQYKMDMASLSHAKQLEKIEQLIQKNLRLRELLKGCIIGHFTAEEWAYYQANDRNVNKRIMSLLVQRVQSVF